MTRWYSGPPPRIGWWPASASEDTECLRWWNGLYWSNCCWRSYTLRAVSRFAATPNDIIWPGEIKWTDRPAWWPARSRT